MPKELEIDQAVYLVDDKTKTYRFLKRDPDWKNLDPGENQRNKKYLEGY